MSFFALSFLLFAQLFRKCVLKHAVLEISDGTMGCEASMTHFISQLRETHKFHIYQATNTETNAAGQPGQQIRSRIYFKVRFWFVCVFRVQTFSRHLSFVLPEKPAAPPVGT